MTLVAVLALGIADVTAGAGRTRPGGSGSSSGSGSSGGPPPQRASGRATYGYGGSYYGYPGGYYGYYGYYGSPYYYGWAAWPWGWWYASRPYYAVRAAVPPGASGVIETDVSPKKAEVRVDGEFVGQARDFNGHWDYLWLEPGEHVLEFGKDGFMTLRRHLKVRPGMHVRIVEQLAKGEGIDPRSSERPSPTEAARSTAPAPPPPEPRPAAGTLRRGLLRLDVEPLDAAVYLDGEFLARASELRRLHGALPVADGVHTVEVVRPGYESRTVEVEVVAGKPARVEIVLVKPN